MTFKNFLHLR